MFTCDSGGCTSTGGSEAVSASEFSIGSCSSVSVDILLELERLGERLGLL